MRGTFDVAATNGFLTNASEELFLYKWNGLAGTNVQDVDYFIYGAGIKSSKTGVGTYLADTAIASQQNFDGGTNATTSYSRGCYNELTETKTGGNGITGHDETSEPVNSTWFIGAPNPGVKTPGSVP